MFPYSIIYRLHRPNTEIHKQRDTWKFGYGDTKRLGCKDTVVQAYIDTWIQGFGLQGYKDTEINRFRVTWIQGYGEIHVCRDK